MPPQARPVANGALSAAHKQTDKRRRRRRSPLAGAAWWASAAALGSLLALAPAAYLVLHDGDGQARAALLELLHSQGHRDWLAPFSDGWSWRRRRRPPSLHGQPQHNNNELAALLSDLRQRPVPHPDPLKTTRCENNDGVRDARGRQRPLVQYALMIDAGSTGSRIHVYKFNNCGPSPELETDVFELVKGGLSAPAYAASPQLAADSLRPLLNLALKEVPASLHACTPISVKATAGLRLLGVNKAEAILLAVRRMLEDQYPFPIADSKGTTSGVEIMDGRDEGVFAFITVNYLLNRLGDPGSRSGRPNSYAQDLVSRSYHEHHSQTAAVLDLGGGSTQIVFEPSFEGVSSAVKEEAKHIGMHPGEHVYELHNFGPKPHILYQSSYLGYGLMQARSTVNALTLHAYLLSHPLGAPPRAAVRRSPSSASRAPQDTLVDTSRDEPPLEPIPSWDGMNQSNTHIPSPCYGPRYKRELVRVERAGALGSASSQAELDRRAAESQARNEGGLAWLRRAPSGSGGINKAGINTTALDLASSSRNVTFFGGNGGFRACRRFVEIVMDKDAACTLPPCSFAGVYQPPLVSTFRDAPIIALSYFYDRLVPLLGTKHEHLHRHLIQEAQSSLASTTASAAEEPVNLSSRVATYEEERSASFTLLDLRQLAEKVCAGPVRRPNVSEADVADAYARFFDDDVEDLPGTQSVAAQRLAALDASLWDWTPIFPPETHPQASAELFHRPESCLDITFMYALLSHGYELPEDREVVLAKKLGGVELGWCLGAQLAVLEDEALQCRDR